MSVMTCEHLILFQTTFMTLIEEKKVVTTLNVYLAFAPPPTRRISPLTQLAASEAKYRHAAPIS